MILNHLNLTVTDAMVTREFLDTHPATFHVGFIQPTEQRLPASVREGSMRLLRVVLFTLLVTPMPLAAEDPQAPQGPATIAASASPRKLPVKRVVLYKNGIGFFEHLGQITGNQVLAIDFTSAQLDDVLASLTVLDLNGGKVDAVGYNSDAPLSRRLGALRLPIDADTSATAFLGALRGARVEVTRGGTAAVGRLLSVERRRQGQGDRAQDVDQLAIVTDAGEVRLFELGPGTSVRLLERDLNDRVGRYLGLVASARDRDLRRMTIDATGQGTRRLYVSYVSEVPVWKTTYRLVLPSDAGGKTLLQGWAIVDNTVGEDWEDVDLSLVAGAPVSFIQQLSQPFYTSRPVVPLPSSVLLSPQTHQGTLTAGNGSLTGTVTDSSGSALPGATVRLVDGAGRTVLRATTDMAGAYRLSNVPAGAFTVVADLAGFRSASGSVSIDVGAQATADFTMEAGAMSETVTVTAAPAPPPAFAGSGGGRYAGGVVGGVAGGIPDARPDFARQMAAQPVAATGRDLGDLFEYKVERPVTIRQNQSALVPILQADVRADRVSLWSAGGGAGERPLRAVWLTNTSPLTLDAGSFTLLDRNTFAGEGLIDPIKPNERRLLSYAVDLAVRVQVQSGEPSRRVSRMRAVHGVVISETQLCSEHTYTVRNEDSLARTLVIEHPLTAGWTLVPGTPAPAETSSSAYRFTVPLEARKGSSLVVREAHLEEAQFAVSDLTDDQVTFMARDLQLGAKGLDELRALMAKKSEIAALGQDLAAKEADVQRIAADQARVRENMKALKGSAEEKRLVERYVQQINEQEDRLASVRTASDDLRQRQQRLEAELTQMIERLVFDAGANASSACPAR